jgi:hypothetical protein
VILKAKPTIYEGHRYRSRTEARWAHYFNLLEIKYLPDPQSITIRFDSSLFGFPTNYIPDFRFPDIRVWAEVKGAVDLTPTEKGKVIGLVSGTGEPCLVLQGIPQVKPYPCLLTEEFAETNEIPINKVVSETTEKKVVLTYVLVKGLMLDFASSCNCGAKLEMTSFCDLCFDSDISEAVNGVAWKRDWEGVEGEDNTTSELSSLMDW